MTYTLRHSYLRPARSLPSLPEPTSISQLNLLPNPLKPQQTPHRSSSQTSASIQQPPYSPTIIATSTPSPRDNDPLASQLLATPTCALCKTHLPDPSSRYNFPATAPAALAALPQFLTISISNPTSPLFCKQDWIRIHDLSICWTCGDIVTRGEERGDMEGGTKRMGGRERRGRDSVVEVGRGWGEEVGMEMEMEMREIGGG
ncbi:MAG: hypothetical protein Q9186_006401 [Xanthomendoza sp. 1 TL-2023]